MPVLSGSLECTILLVPEQGGYVALELDHLAGDGFWRAGGPIKLPASAPGQNGGAENDDMATNAWRILLRWLRAAEWCPERHKNLQSMEQLSLIREPRRWQGCRAARLFPSPNGHRCETDSVKRLMGLHEWPRRFCCQQPLCARCQEGLLLAEADDVQRSAETPKKRVLLDGAGATIAKAQLDSVGHARRRASMVCLYIDGCLSGSPHSWKERRERRDECRLS